MYHPNRRQFLACSAAATLAAAASTRAQTAAPGAPAPMFKTTLKKALIVGRPNEANLKPIKEAGFDGVETTDWKANADEAKAAREVADKIGLRVHSVLYGWAQFNDKDPAKVDKYVAECQQALRACAAYGVEALLLVPCRIGGAGMAIPEAWEFRIEFDDKTGRLTRVVEGDNSKYQAYLDAHNQALDASIANVKKLIPTAEETKVVIALENVWNNLWVQPAPFQWFVASFKHPLVKAYLDLGNHVKYAPTEQWVRALGSLIAKCHVKDFKLKADGHGGDWAKVREGSINWPVVRQALDEVGYNGWLTIESGGLTQKEHNDRLDLIAAGK